ncbi:MAG: hypothetical protein GY797_10860 [Deltaproteobacteria bacterium]|nr:hypothetical protein [Deltaproteobacteria bacterium]MCP5006256.1 hypothetical protein [Planctomycetota bacterium]
MYLKSFFRTAVYFVRDQLYNTPAALRGMSAEEYNKASQAFDEKCTLDEKYSEECPELSVFFMPHHPENAQIFKEQCFERLGRIAEKKGMDTTQFAKNLGGAHSYLTDYISFDEILKRSSAVGDEWAEMGQIEIFFELLEDGVELPTSYEDILVLQILKGKDENKRMENADLTLDDVKKYMGTPAFHEASKSFNQEIETSVNRQKPDNVLAIV